MKTYKGYELIKAIEDRQIEEGTEFKVKGYEVMFKYLGGDRLVTEYAEPIEACYFIDTEIEKVGE